MRRAPFLPIVLASLVLGGCGASGSPSAQPQAGGAPPASASLSASTPTSASAPAGGSASASVTPGAPLTYVALGDSYSAAPGVPTSHDAGGCQRSSHNYPHLLAAALSATLTDVTCTSAATEDLTSPQRLAPVRIPPQLDALTPTTGLVTLGIGGNDLNLFSTVLGRCLSGDARCLRGARVRQELAVVQQRLSTALQQIHQRAPVARVVLVGYPQLVPAGDTGCAALPLAPAVLAQMRRLTIDLSTTMAAAATTGGATYVDLIGPSKGHDLCSATPWINGPQTNGQAMAYHPFVNEQRAVARLVRAALS